MYGSLRMSGCQEGLNLWPRDTGLKLQRTELWSHWCWELLIYGLWVLRRLCGMKVKLYIKYLIYWTVVVLSSELWSLQLWNQFMQLRIKKPQRVRTSRGFKPLTSRYRFDALTNWAMKALMLGAGHLCVVGHKEPVTNECEVIYKIFNILKSRCEFK